MKNKDTVFILNYAPHYREFIFKRIGEELKSDFYFGSYGDGIKKANYNNIPGFKKEFKTIKIWNFYFHIKSLFIFFKSYKNIVLSGDPYLLSNWIILLLAKFTSKNTFLWTHGWYGKEKGLNKWIKKVYFKLADTLFVYNHFSKENLISMGFDCKKIVVIYNSLDYNNQLRIKENLKKDYRYQNYFNNNNPVLFFIGRIQYSKKLEQILDALLILNSKDIKFNFAILGNEVNNYNFRKEILNRDLDKQVWLIGESYNELEIAEYIFNANICVSPGNIGLTALHSLVYNLPVITHNNFINQMPEFESIIQGKNGLYFKENDIEDLADKISKIIKIDFLNVSEEIDKKWNLNNQISIFKKYLN